MDGDPSSSASCAGVRAPEIKGLNPLFSTLRRKARRFFDRMEGKKKLTQESEDTRRVPRREAAGLA